MFFQKKEIKGGDFIAEIGDNFNDFQLQLICGNQVLSINQN